MKVKLKAANYIEFVNPRNIKIGDKIILEYNTINSSISMAWQGKIVTIKEFPLYSMSKDLFRIKEDNRNWFWDKCWIKHNYSNYKFEVL